MTNVKPKLTLICVDNICHTGSPICEHMVNLCYDDGTIKSAMMGGDTIYQIGVKMPHRIQVHNWIHFSSFGKN